jgi:hypothetical protein
LGLSSPSGVSLLSRIGFCWLGKKPTYTLLLLHNRIYVTRPPLLPADTYVRLSCICGNARGNHANPEYPERACRTIHDSGLHTSAAPPFSWRISRWCSQSGLPGRHGDSSGRRSSLVHRRMFTAEARPLISRRHSTLANHQVQLPHIQASLPIVLPAQFQDTEAVFVGSEAAAFRFVQID